MAGIVYSADNTKFSFAEAQFALVSEGHLSIYGSGAHRPSEILAVFAAGTWTKFVRDAEAVRTKNSSSTVLSVNAAPES